MYTHPVCTSLLALLSVLVRWVILKLARVSVVFGFYFLSFSSRLSAAGVFFSFQIFSIFLDFIFYRSAATCWPLVFFCQFSDFYLFFWIFLNGPRLARVGYQWVSPVWERRRDGLHSPLVHSPLVALSVWSGGGLRLARVGYQWVSPVERRRAMRIHPPFSPGEGGGGCCAYTHPLLPVGRADAFLSLSWVPRWGSNLGGHLFPHSRFQITPLCPLGHEGPPYI